MSDSAASPDSAGSAQGPGWFASPALARLARWPGESLHVQYDRETGAWIVIAVFSTVLGPAGGGTRFKTYRTLDDAIADAMALSEAMAYKWALAELPMGGGKAVLALPEGSPPLEDAARAALLRRYGAFVAQLGGLFQTGPDVGTTPEDMDTIAETGGSYVHSRASDGPAGGSSVPTAWGVLAGIQAALQFTLGSDELAGRTVAVQGLGGVGGMLAEQLATRGAGVVVADVSERALERFRGRDGFEIAEPERILESECDVLAPCALGGVLGADSIPRLRCRIVAGAANNQLARPEDADRLRERDILYAPDYAINLGGALGVVGSEQNGWDESEAAERVATVVRSTLLEIFERARGDGISTEAAARRVAESRIRAGAAALGDAGG